MTLKGKRRLVRFLLLGEFPGKVKTELLEGDIVALGLFFFVLLVFLFLLLFFFGVSVCLFLFWYFTALDLGMDFLEIGKREIAYFSTHGLLIYPYS